MHRVASTFEEVVRFFVFFSFLIRGGGGGGGDHITALCHSRMLFTVCITPTSATHWRREGIPSQTHLGGDGRTVASNPVWRWVDFYETCNGRHSIVVLMLLLKKTTKKVK